MGKREDEFVGVILAAGKGSRMTQLPTRLPKPVLPILNKPIICHQLDAMGALGIRKAIIVVGAQGDDIAREIERAGNGHGVEIEYVLQEEALGIAHCVGCLESRLDGPFLGESTAMRPAGGCSRTRQG